MDSEPFHFDSIPLDIKKNIILGYVRRFARTSSLLDSQPQLGDNAHSMTTDYTTGRSQIIVSIK